ncbi:NAD(P)-dependent oxidoreductase [Spirosoma sp. KCTC 42546]|uniref:NAD(P)-dependent oxidoreductase n=1 Tax=Spirosoma sp. KCTC 42546 TaxID=2520506 RepID=UPI00143DD7B4|nr:SDR family oxidoreductase [Spirosoma sp. KCTC 42546]
MNTPTHKQLSILVFGATGGTGSQFVKLALEAGHRVTAIVRNPAALAQQHPNLRVVKGDAMVLETFSTQVQGHNAVVSCLGVKKLKPTTVYSVSVANILRAMQGTDVSRLLCISSSAIEVSPKLPWVLRMLTKYVLARIFKHVYADTRLMEQALKKSNVDWTSVRPPRLTNKPLTENYRYAINTFLDKCFQISRADLAHFMLHHLTDRQMIRAVVEVAN